MRASDLSWFGVPSAPFSKEIGDDDLWMPSSKAELIDDLAEAIEARATVLLTGEPGVGKTCVLRALRRRLSPDTFRLTYCHNATLGRRDFYRQLCVALGLAPSATAAAVFYAVSTHVEELGRDRVHPVFLLDEAHLLHQDVLDHLHILLNYEWDSRALLSLVLVGLPELENQLERRRNRSLYSRIHHRYAVDDASANDIAEYVGYRLRLAGAEKNIFAAERGALGRRRGSATKTSASKRMQLVELVAAAAPAPRRAAAQYTVRVGVIGVRALSPGDCSWSRRARMPSPALGPTTSENTAATSERACALPKKPAHHRHGEREQRRDR